MKGFDQFSLCALAVSSVLGMIAPFTLAARNRKPHLALLAFLIATWAVVVLVSSAVML